MTDANGHMVGESDSYPFAGERQVLNAVDLTYKFAGMEYDPETAVYHTLHRQYSPNLARWLSPDPVAGDISNPQSLNRYAYVLNNATNLTDPQGLSLEPEDAYTPGTYGGPRTLERRANPKRASLGRPTRRSQLR